MFYCYLVNHSEPKYIFYRTFISAKVRLSEIILMLWKRGHQSPLGYLKH